jgi:uncharacterized protein YbaA (DUF1428 family)
MGNWFFNLSVPWMALIIFLAAYIIAGSVDLVVTRLAVNEKRVKGFKAISPGMLPPLGILFALLVGFIAVEVWRDFANAKAAVTTEASALRAVILLAGAFPDERSTIYALVNRQIDETVNKEWPEMAHQRATLAALPTALIEALHETLALKPADAGQRAAQLEMVKAIHTALDARRRRIVISQSTLATVKWVGILLQGLCTLVAFAAVHSDNRLARTLTLALFATGLAMSMLLIAAYGRPFSGEISIGPELLKQVIASEVPFGG